MEKVIEKIYCKGYRKAIITIELSDPYKSGRTEFMITAICYKKNKDGQWIKFRCGTCRKEIVRACPELSEFVQLNDSDEQGKEFFYYENALCWYRERGIVDGSKILRVPITIGKKIFDEYNANAKDSTHCEENRLLFDTLLVKYGVFDLWQKQADKLKAYIKGQ